MQFRSPCCQIWFLMVYFTLFYSCAFGSANWQDLISLSDSLKEDGKMDSALVVAQEAYAQIQYDVNVSDTSRITILIKLGRLASFLEEFEQSETYYRDAIEITSQTGACEEDRTVVCMEKLGWVLKDQGRFDEAAKVLKESLDLAESVAEPQQNQNRQLPYGHGSCLL